MTVCSLAQMYLDFSGYLLKDHNFCHIHSVLIVCDYFLCDLEFMDFLQIQPFGLIPWPEIGLWVMLLGSPDRMLLFHSCRNIILSLEAVGQKVSYNPGSPYFMKWILTQFLFRLFATSLCFKVFTPRSDEHTQLKPIWNKWTLPKGLVIKMHCLQKVWSSI